MKYKEIEKSYYLSKKYKKAFLERKYYYHLSFFSAFNVGVIFLIFNFSYSFISLDLSIYGVRYYFIVISVLILMMLHVYKQMKKYSVAILLKEENINSSIKISVRAIKKWEKEDKARRKYF